MYELAKSSREKMKAKARRLAGEKDQKVDSSDWSPAAPLRTEVKTGARPIMKPSAKGIGESNAAADTKAAIGDIKRGAYKSGGAVKKRVKKDIGGTIKNLATSGLFGLGGKLLGDSAKRADDERDQQNWRNAQMVAAMPRKEGGGVYDKKALGAIDPRAKREATPKPYKKGGRIKREDGGKLPDPYEAMRSEERMGRMKVEEKRKLPPPKEAAESAARTGDVPEGKKAGGGKWIQSAIKKPGSLRKSLGVKEGETIPAKKLEAASENGGKLGKRARLAQTLKKIAKKKGGSVGLTVVIADKGGRQQQATPAMPPMPRGVPMPMPAPAQGAMGAPGPAPMMPPGAVGAAPPAQMPMMRKAGGRVYRSYKDLDAGAASGPGRLEKTEIESRHTDAPARKTGGRISKVAKSYKDMTAGSESGFGRMQKISIAKRRVGAPKA